MPSSMKNIERKSFFNNFKIRPIIIIINENADISNEKRKAVKEVPIFAPKIKANADFSLMSFDDKKAIVITVKVVEEVKRIVIIIPRKKDEW